jgi:diguanylate cyclase (GGDEF)-like protein
MTRGDIPTENLNEHLSLSSWCALLTLVTTPIVLLEEQRIVSMSTGATEVLGIEPGTRDQTFVDLFAEEDHERLTNVLRAVETGDAEVIDVSMRNGYQTCELQIRKVATSPHSSAVVVALRDTTSEQAAQLTILYSASRHRAILEGLREGVIVLDHNGRVSEANRAASLIFSRLSAQPLVGSSHSEILESSSADNVPVPADQLPTSRALTDGQACVDVVLRLEGIHGPRWLSFSCQPIDAVTGPQGAVLSVHDVTAHTIAETDLAFLAHHDSLTGLANRTRLHQDMQQVASQRRSSDQMTVLVIDLDGFKDVNDSHGHQAGDQVLIEIAARLRNSCRSGDLVARLGGDEFAVLLGPDGRDALECANRIIQIISSPIYLEDNSVSVGASVGIAIARGDSVEIDHLLMCADTAMYAAKKSGKGIALHFEEDMLDRVLRRAELRAAIDHAVTRSEFSLLYQPKVNLFSRQVVGFEALLRWTKSNGEEMHPSEFVPVAEETGQIVVIGRWVLEKAAAQLATWQREHNRFDLTMAVNLSARQLTDDTFIHDVARVLATTQIDPKTLTLELTETMLIEDPRVIADALAKLRDLGVLLAIDDYGSGNASISYLRHFAIDVLKVDRSLVLALDEDPLAGQAVVRSITDLAASLKLTTVAEGIEREDQIELLRTLGCDEGQGFHLAMPLSVVEVSEFLSKDLEIVAMQ